MEEKKWEDYIDEVLSFVKFKYEHKAIRRELAEHMEDMKEDLMAEGMNEVAAEIGRALDQEHGAVLGWIWRITRALAILLIVVNFMPLFHLVGGMAGGLFQKYEPQSESAEVWHMELDRGYQVYDDTLILEDIYYYEDGTLTVIYRTKYKPFAKSIHWSSMISLGLFTEEGDKLPKGGGGFKNGGYNGIGWQSQQDVPREAKWLEIYYSGLTVTVDLETGEVTDNAET